MTRLVLGLDDEDASTGVPLSGGQWQRLALARAFMREDADLLVLDEPSSGLDAEAEHDIHRSLTRFRQGRTSVLISHRLGAVRAADTIVVLTEASSPSTARTTTSSDATARTRGCSRCSGGGTTSLQAPTGSPSRRTRDPGGVHAMCAESARSS